MKGRVNKIVNASKKSGVKHKEDGTSFEWNIMTVEIVQDDNKTVVADSFDKLEIGSVVEVTQSGEYTNAKLYKANPTNDKLDEILVIVKEIKDAIVSPAVSEGKDVADFFDE